MTYGELCGEVLARIEPGDDISWALIADTVAECLDLDPIENETDIERIGQRVDRLL